MTKGEAYIQAKGLVATDDPEIRNPTYRKPGFEGIKTFEEMDERIGRFLREHRKKAGLTRAEFAPLLGLSTQVFGRYERAFSKLNVTRMIQLCELLDFTPVEMIHEAAPHLFGETRQEAQDRLALAKLVTQLPHRTTTDLLRLVEHLIEKQEEEEPGDLEAAISE